MQMQELDALLVSTGLPVTYHHWNVDEENPMPQLPYIAYMLDGTNVFSADDKVLLEIESYNIELYTAIKDVDIEKKLENVLKENEIIWEKTEVYIKEEKMYQIIYSVQI